MFGKGLCYRVGTFSRDYTQWLGTSPATQPLTNFQLKALCWGHRHSSGHHSLKTSRPSDNLMWKIKVKLLPLSLPTLGVPPIPAHFVAFMKEGKYIDYSPLLVERLAEAFECTQDDKDRWK